MTRKHFEAIAKMMKQCHPLDDHGWPEPANLWSAIRSDLADICAAENPSFDRKRFTDACSPGGN